LRAYNPKTDNEEKISLESLKWKWVVLFFYPADFTFVCPTELKDMANEETKFKELWVEVLSVSTDTIFSHKAWIRQEKLMEWFPYKMLSDHTTEISAVYNLLNEKDGTAW
jgi:peroxiredoxin (alkyl hydroperoxide reductase subunit C)